jgi:hypothetical protein
VSSTTPESGNPPTPSVDPASNGGEKSTSSGDTLFLAGAVPLSVIIGSGLFFKRLPEGLQHRIEQIVLDPVHRWVALGVAAVFAAITAVAIVREIGHARLIAGWSFFRNLGPTGLLGLLNLVMPPLAGLALLWAMGATNIGPWMKSHGAIAVVVYAIAFAVLAGLSLLPTYAQAALGGWAFGVAWGLPAALVGFVGGAMIGYGLARRLSGDRIEAMIDKKPKWKAVRCVGGHQRASRRPQLAEQFLAQYRHDRPAAAAPELTVRLHQHADGVREGTSGGIWAGDDAGDAASHGDCRDHRGGVEHLFEEQPGVGRTQVAVGRGDRRDAGNRADRGNDREQGD